MVLFGQPEYCTDDCKIVRNRASRGPALLENLRSWPTTKPSIPLRAGTTLFGGFANLLKKGWRMAWGLPKARHWQIDCVTCYGARHVM